MTITQKIRLLQSATERLKRALRFAEHISNELIRPGSAITLKQLTDDAAKAVDEYVKSTGTT